MRMVHEKDSTDSSPPSRGSWIPLLFVLILLLLRWIFYGEGKFPIQIRRWYNLKVCGGVVKYTNLVVASFLSYLILHILHMPTTNSMERATVYNILPLLFTTISSESSYPKQFGIS
jgi:hypothetical protein